MSKRHNRAVLRAFMAQHELTADSVAALLHVEPQTVRTWTSSGPRCISWDQLMRLDQLVYQQRSAHWRPLSAAPTIQCVSTKTDDGGQLYRFFCEYCNSEHVHGAPYGGRIHRVAHCNGGRIIVGPGESRWTPYADHGYYLEVEA